MRKNVETYVTGPVFVLHHDDGQVEIISSSPYIGVMDDNFEAARDLWHVAIDEWARDCEAGEINSTILKDYQMPLTTKWAYHVQCAWAWARQNFSASPSQQKVHYFPAPPSQNKKIYPWREQLAH